MKKFTIVLTVLIAMTITTNAQWITLTSGITVDLESVYFTDANTGYLGGGGKILKTTDGGTTWTAQTIGYYAFRSIYFPCTTVGYAVTDGGGILKTTDSGTNWSYQTSGITSPLRSVYFVNNDTGYVCGEGGVILKTTDGGINWTSQISGVSNNLYSVYFTDNNTGYIVGFSSIILKTTDGGANWTSQSGNTTYDLYSVCFSDANTGYSVGGNNQGSGIILKTTDAGANWAVNWTPSIANCYFFSIYFPDQNNGFAVGIFGRILKTSDGGANWYIQRDSTGGDSENLLACYFLDANTGYAVGKAGNIIKTTNGGTTGMSEYIVDKHITIYPNPASDLVSLNIDNFDNENVRLTIYDICGNLVKSETLKQNQRQINIRNLSNGTYLVEIKSKEWTGKQKLIIQR